MTKEHIERLSHEELVREYPITELLPGWFFRQTEKSPGVWDVEGRDAYGRIVSRCSVIDEEQALAECVEYARQLAEQRRKE
jgi:hypothetical protein